MLTSKSNFNTLRELKGKKITEEALQQLYNNCISKDFINLNGNISKGYPAEIANFIMQKIDVTKADKIKILVLNDLSFHMYNCLTNAGILPKNITLAFGKWNKDGTPLNDKKVYNIMSMFAKSNFVEFGRDASNIVTLEEIMNMKNNIKFDYIISNPPYEIGNIITKSIIDSVDFDHFINLMPISKYKANKLYQHILPNTIVHAESTVGFDGAYTTPICAELTKDILSDCLYEEFEVRVIFDQRLSKFWDEQLKRKPPYLLHMLGVKQKYFKDISSKTSFSCGIYTPNIMLSNGPKTLKNRDGSFKIEDKHYVWNFLKPAGSLDTCFEPIKTTLDISQTITVFATEQEADNFKNWAHSGELTGKGRLQGLFSILLRAMNKPTSCPFPYAIPRVDWTHPWTDEEILKDYGYTPTEINDILHFNDDLKTATVNVAIEEENIENETN